MSTIQHEDMNKPLTISFHSHLLVEIIYNSLSYHVIYWPDIKLIIPHTCISIYVVQALIPKLCN